MFDDFKEKIRQYSDKEKTALTTYSPEVLEKLKQRGIDPNNITLKQLFPETLDEEGNDLSLMSGAETEVMVTYAKTRKYLLKNYPQTQEEARLLGMHWDEEPNEPYQIDLKRSIGDPKRKVFVDALNKMAAVYEKIAFLQQNATEYEKLCLRLYWHITYNWDHAEHPTGLRKILENGDLFEIVEAYFRICKKYSLPVFEEPYSFLPEQQRLEVKLEGDMLKRTTNHNDFETHISILETLA
jgi:hypothetical protein